MNKHLRILIAILLVAVMVFGVVGCAGDGTPDDTSAPTQDSSNQNGDDSTETTTPANGDNNNGDNNNGGNNNGGNTENGGNNNGGATEKDPTFKQVKGVNTIGFRSNDSSYLDWAGAGVEYHLDFAEAGSVTIELEVITPDTVDDGTCLVDIFLDGSLLETKEFECNSGSDEVILVEVPSAGKHVLKLVKMTDASIASVAIKAVNTDATYADVTVEEALAVEFIGAGELIIGKGLNEDDSDLCDLSKSAAWKVATDLGLNYQFTGWDFEDFGISTVIANYLKAAPTRDLAATYKFYTNADVVVIALEDGTADEYADLLDLIRLWNDPQTKIICCITNADTATAINAAATDMVGVYVLDLTAAEDAAAALKAQIEEVQDDVLSYGEPVIDGGAFKDWTEND